MTWTDYSRQPEPHIINTKAGFQSLTVRKWNPPRLWKRERSLYLISTYQIVWAWFQSCGFLFFWVRVHISWCSACLKVSLCHFLPGIRGLVASLPVALSTLTVLSVSVPHRETLFYFPSKFDLWKYSADSAWLRHLSNGEGEKVCEEQPGVSHQNRKLLTSKQLFPGS